MSDTSWKCVEFFKDVIVRDLSLEHSDVFTITDFNVGKASEKTAGYMSLIHRVCIEVEFESNPDKSTSLSYIVKEKSDSAFGNNLVEALSVFPREFEMYEKLLPAFERLFEERHPIRFGPRVFKTSSTPHYTVIVMEDLTRSRFYMREKRFNLPMSDVRAVLRKLAAFHAASVVYRKNGGTVSDLLSVAVFAEKTGDILMDYYEPLYKSFLLSLQQRNVSAEYLQPLMALDGRLLKTSFEVQRIQPSEFNVIVHSDLWPNNIMFGDDDLRFLDFQTAFYGSFASDLLYFFTTSATELMCDSLEEMLQFYYEHLVKAFGQLQHDDLIPPYADLLQQMKRRGVLIFTPLSEAVAITMSGLTEPSEIEMITSDQPEGVALRERVYNNPSFVELVDRLLPKLFEFGVFDKTVSSVN